MRNWEKNNKKAINAILNLCIKQNNKKTVDIIVKTYTKAQNFLHSIFINHFFFFSSYPFFQVYNYLIKIIYY